MPYRPIETALRQCLCAAIVLMTQLWGGPASYAEELPSLDEAIALHDAGQYAEAFEMFLPLAEAGVIKAQNRLAHMYYWGEGTEKDPQKHHEWSMRSAALGDPYGQFDVATAYFSGRLFPADDEIGMEWLIKSAEGGDPYALLGLGIKYIYGDGVPRDLEHGVDLLRRAATAGDPHAQTALGILLTRGEGATSQARRKEGAKWIWRAGQQREPGAQYLLSELALTSGRADSIVEAGAWLVLSDNAGCAAAGPTLLTLFSTISDAEEMAAIERAAEWDEAMPPKNPHDHRRPAPICNILAATEAWR